MVERISTNQIYLRSQNGIQRSFNSLFRAQSLLTGGTNITRPSDDPAGARRVLSLESERETIARYRSNLQTLEGISQETSGALETMSATLTEIRALAVQAATGTNDRSALANIATEIDQLYRVILSTANGQASGRYLFAGSAIDREPFAEVSGPDGLNQVIYRGNRDPQTVEIGPSLTADLNMPGSELLGNGRTTNVRFSGSTGAQAGTGTSSGQGRDQLQIIHTRTSFGGSPLGNGADPATGVRPGLGSVSGDTVLGTSSSINLTTDAFGAGSVSLNGGPAVSFNGTENSLRVTDADGRELILDVTGLTANLGGVDVAVSSEGAYSLDGGQTTVAIDFSRDNQAVRDSLTGAVLFVDSRNVDRAGTEEVIHEGSFDIFNTLIALRDVLRDPNRSVNEIGDEVRSRIEDIDRGVETITTALGRVGGRLAQADLITERLGDLDLTLQTLRSDILDPDISETISDVTRYQTIYEASLLIASRIRQTSLANFL